MSDDQKLYSTKQAAKFLGVSVRTLKRWKNSGKLVPEKMGHKGRGKCDTFSLEQLKNMTSPLENMTSPLENMTSPLENMTSPLEMVQSPLENMTSPLEMVQNGQQKKVGKRLPVPQALVNRLLNGGTKTVVSKTNDKKETSVEVEVEEIEEYYFDDDDDITIVNESFKATLPEEYRQNLTKLFGKLTEAPMNEVFCTPFNNAKTLITYAKIDYVNSGVTFNGKFNKMHELILNSLYSFYRSENILFTSRNILQHIFGNISDHFQSGLVKIIDQHLDELRCMRISMDLKDKFGNNAPIKIHGEKYRPTALHEDILDVSILEMKSAKNSKIVMVYRINRLSPIFKYAEKLKQITSWQTEYMKVPVRKTMQNAILCNYFLTKISLVRNSKNKYKNNGILFTTIQKDLNLDVSDRNKAKRIRDSAQKMFDYWVEIGLLESYCFEKKGTAFYKISFTVASDNIKEANQID